MDIRDLHDEIHLTAEPEVGHRTARGWWDYQIAPTRHGWAYRWGCGINFGAYSGCGVPWGPYYGPWPATRDEAIAVVTDEITRRLQRNLPGTSELLDALAATTSPTLF